MASLPSVLIIGATGGTGKACLAQLSNHPSKPSIHAFCRDPAKITNRDLFTSVQTGNARKSQDIEAALQNTQANWIIVCVGNGEDTSKNDIRQANAEATVAVLKKPAYQHVRVMVVSSTGASTSKIVVGFGIGVLISYHLRHILADHSAQEAAFGKLPQRRVTVVRATALTGGEATGKLAVFGDKKKSPTIKTDRQDLAEWIAEEICNARSAKIVNVTSVKQ